MTSINIGKIYGFDYLRAVCCIIVVAIHSDISGLFWRYNHIHEVVLYNIFSLAVPIFMQTALVLFFINRQKYPDYFLKKRFFKIIKLYLFWGLFAHIFNLAFQNTAYTNFLHQPLTWKNTLAFILQDGYSNPFYFLFSLLFVTILAELISILMDKTQIKSEFIIYPGLILSSIIVFLLPLIPRFLGTEFDIFSQVCNPFNFIPYIFSSFLISQNLIIQKQTDASYQINYLQIFILLLMLAIFAFVEYKYFSQTFIFQGIEHKYFSAYSRLSLVFTAWLITVISLKISLLPNSIIQLMSDLSLGIYCLHGFIYMLLSNPMMVIVPSPTYLRILLFIITLISAALITKFLKMFSIFQDII